MPYRGLERPGTACYRHDAAQATETCVGCLQTICDICVGYENTQPHCPPCAQRVRRRRMIGRSLTAALGLLAVAGVLGGAAWMVTREKPFDYKVWSGEVHALEDRLAAEPCDRQVALNLSDTMLRAGDNRGALKRIEAFEGKCGNWSRLTWVTYTAHERLSEHGAAIADATRLINEQPDDKDFWWWRGMAYEETGQLDRAVSDYRKSLEVEPRLTGIPFNLAGVLERQGKFCDARQPILQFLQFHPDVKDRETVEARLSRLDARCSK